jgi:DNA-binding NarL/FixJ family response regulator
MNVYAVDGDGDGHDLAVRLSELFERCTRTAQYARRTQEASRAARAAMHAARQRRAAEVGTTRAAALERRRTAVGLTGRQHEILLLVAEGLGTKQIAATLWLSPATVRNHVAAILGALDAHSRLQAVATARRLGLLDVPAGLKDPAH